MAQVPVKLSPDVHAELREQSQKSGIPMARMVDRWLRRMLQLKVPKETK